MKLLNKQKIYQMQKVLLTKLECQCDLGSHQSVLYKFKYSKNKAKMEYKNSVHS
jgi:hypothetical protein